MATKAKSKSTTVKRLNDVLQGWHFLNEGMELQYGDKRVAKVGKTISIDGHETPIVCHRGLHASHNASDAALFNRGPVLTFVEVWGDVDSPKDGDKFCGRHRKVLWAFCFTKKFLRGLTSKQIKLPRNWKREVELCGITELLNLLARYDSEGFNALVNRLKDLNVQSEQSLYLDEGAILAQLMPRVVRTKKEILSAIRKVSSAIEFRSEDGDDLFEDIIFDLDSSGKIAVVEIGHEDGYVLRPSKR